MGSGKVLIILVSGSGIHVPGSDIFVPAAALLIIFNIEVRAEEMEEVVEDFVIKPNELGRSQKYAGGDYHRRARSADNCEYPSVLEDSQLDCKVYPSKITCTQTCTFGHTFPEGPKREMTCRFMENRWTPYGGFDRCKPFVDCSLRLLPGGKYKCHTNFLDRAPFCDISCSAYEDKAAVERKTYQCDIRGQWTPSLPFCARSGSGTS
ncbi:uncharacterized protein LOC129216710 [Uloborus diversus]|uniref:uncharacterized protein LOC129216710 n=1 Tax=Uloborus diversus TaxID=327109 RepID=UPI00240A73C3|nr:uncharacterized protein LOC129216710 [Uloborus diversus]